MPITPHSRTGSTAGSAGSMLKWRRDATCLRLCLRAAVLLCICKHQGHLCSPRQSCACARVHISTRTLSWTRCAIHQALGLWPLMHVSRGAQPSLHSCTSEGRSSVQHVAEALIQPELQRHHRIGPARHCGSLSSPLSQHPCHCWSLQEKSPLS